VDGDAEVGEQVHVPQVGLVASRPRLAGGQVHQRDDARPRLARLASRGCGPG
jgi:hypothetical protein